MEWPQRGPVGGVRCPSRGPQHALVVFGSFSRRTLLDSLSIRLGGGRCVLRGFWCWTVFGLAGVAVASVPGAYTCFRVCAGAVLAFVAAAGAVFVCVGASFGWSLPSVASMVHSQCGLRACRLCVFSPCDYDIDVIAVCGTLCCACSFRALMHTTHCLLAASNPDVPQITLSGAPERRWGCSC